METGAKGGFRSKAINRLVSWRREIEYNHVEFDQCMATMEYTKGSVSVSNQQHIIVLIKTTNIKGL